MNEMHRASRFYTICIEFAIIGMSNLVSAFDCNPKCNCIWKNGKQTAECENSLFEKIPSGIDSGVQVLKLSKNNVTFLPRNAFVDAGLLNLQRLYLSKCGTEHIDDFAFHRISNLVELDLSDNFLQHVPSPTFIHIPLLRYLLLTGNPISTISAQAFTDLKNLIILDLSNCKIESISFRAFETLEKLEVLKLDSNNLETLHGRSVLPLRSLHGISIDGNPWRCDCELRSFRMWLDTQKVPYIPPICYRPVRLKSRSWKDINIIEYACPPMFLNTSSASSVYEGSNVTLECKVVGDPIPSVQWIFKDKLITNFSNGLAFKQMFILVDLSDRERMTRLLISSLTEHNTGTYTCVAENLAGQVSKSFTVMLSSRPVNDLKVSEFEEDKIQKVKKDITLIPALKGEHLSVDPNIAAMIVGIVLGTIGVMVIIGVFIWSCRRERRGSIKRTDLPLALKFPNCIEEEIDLTDMKPKTSITKTINLSDSYESNPNDESIEVLSSENIVPTKLWMVKKSIPLDSKECKQNRRGPMLELKYVNLKGRIEEAGEEEENAPRVTLERGDNFTPRSKLNVIYERELGDGSSELDAIDLEYLKIKDLPLPILDTGVLPSQWKESKCDSFINSPTTSSSESRLPWEENSPGQHGSIPNRATAYESGEGTMV